MMVDMPSGIGLNARSTYGSDPIIVKEEKKAF